MYSRVMWPPTKNYTMCLTREMEGLWQLYQKQDAGGGGQADHPMTSGTMHGMSHAANGYKHLQTGADPQAK